MSAKVFLIFHKQILNVRYHILHLKHFYIFRLKLKGTLGGPFPFTDLIHHPSLGKCRDAANSLGLGQFARATTAGILGVLVPVIGKKRPSSLN